MWSDSYTPAFHAPSLAVLPSSSTTTSNTSHLNHRRSRSSRRRLDSQSSKHANSPAQLQSLFSNKSNKNARQQHLNASSADESIHHAPASSSSSSVASHLKSFPAFIQHTLLNAFNSNPTSSDISIQSASNAALHAPSYTASSGRTRRSLYPTEFESGNETDLEAEVDDESHRFDHQLQERMYESDSSSDTHTHDQVSCVFASYGCESKFRRGNDRSHYSDPLVVEHHLSLLQAANAVLMSQKKQLAALLQRENEEKQKITRKLQRRQQRYEQLKSAYDRKKESLNALTHANSSSSQLHSLQDVVASYLMEDFSADAGSVIRSLQHRLKEAESQVRVRDELLVKVLHQHQQQEVHRSREGQVAHTADTLAQTNQVEFIAQVHESQAGGDLSEEEVEDENDEDDDAGVAHVTPSLPNFTPSPGLLPAPVFNLPRMTPLHSTPMLGLVETKLQRAARLASAKAKQAQLAASKEAAQYHSQTSYYSVPHSSLRALAPFFNSATLTQAISVATSSPLSQSHGSELNAAVIDSSQQPGSTSASIPKSQFCPKNWRNPTTAVWNWNNNTKSSP